MGKNKKKKQAEFQESTFDHLDDPVYIEPWDNSGLVDVVDSIHVLTSELNHLIKGKQLPLYGYMREAVNFVKRKLDKQVFDYDDIFDGLSSSTQELAEIASESIVEAKKYIVMLDQFRTDRIRESQSNIHNIGEQARVLSGLKDDYFDLLSKLKELSPSDVNYYDLLIELRSLKNNQRNHRHNLNRHRRSWDHNQYGLENFDLALETIQNTTEMYEEIKESSKKLASDASRLKVVYGTLDVQGKGAIQFEKIFEGYKNLVKILMNTVHRNIGDISYANQPENYRKFYSENNDMYKRGKTVIDQDQRIGKSSLNSQLGRYLNLGGE